MIVRAISLASRERAFASPIRERAQTDGLPLAKGNIPMNRTAIRRPFCLVVLLFATQAYAQSASPTFPNPGKTSMSKENQHALGMEVAAQVYQQMPVLPDNSPESQYVRQLGQKLVATIPQQYSWPFEFHVIPGLR